MNLNYSFLMSIYKNDKLEHLILSVESMINQTFKPSEIVIIVDGPIESNIKEYLSDLKLTYDFMNIIFLEDNFGLGYVLNFGVTACKNELIARMDADDISLPNRIEKQMAFLESNPQCALLGTQIFEIGKKTYRFVPVNFDKIKHFARTRSPFNHPTVIFKKSIILNCGNYNPNLRTKQDYELFSRILGLGYFCFNLNEKLLYYRSSDLNQKRRKSLKYVYGYIKAQYLILKNKNCSLFDFFYVLFSQLLLFFIPLSISQFLTNRFFRKVSHDS